MAEVRLLRFLATGAALAALAVTPSQAAATVSDYDRAASALSDIRLAISAIMTAENDATNGPARYKAAAQRAINCLVGQNDQAYDATAGDPGDTAGAIGQVNLLLDREATPPFVPLLHGVLVDLQSSVANLQDAMKTDGLDDYQEDVSQALQTMEMAEGRPGNFDVFGGMLGAIANTELGVPAGAPTQGCCAAPRKVGYGVWHGWLVWHAVPLTSSNIDTAGSSVIKREGSMLVLYSPASVMVYHLYAANAGAPTAVSPVAALVTKAPQNVVNVADTVGDGAVPYTAAQAKSGEAVYAAHCASCHGTNLQGVAAPAIAGKDFLSTAAKNNYTVSILNTIVTQNMPLNDPASLKPSEYADVMAYLLAANCFPAGNTPYPSNPGDNFGSAPLATPAHPAGTPDANGVCSVK